MQKDRSPLSDTNFRLQAVQAICIGERLFSVGVGILQLGVGSTYESVKVWTVVFFEGMFSNADGISGCLENAYC